jgi:lauroyl/myristoyl acyltransferase
MSGAALHRRLHASKLESRLQVLRAAWPGGWSPEVVLEGRSHLDEALSGGRGAVLWIHRFRPFVHLVALSQAGIRLCRPSAWYHGYFNNSRFGLRYLNPVQARVEDRYGERIVVVEGQLAHLRTLAARLAENRVVGFYADIREQRRSVPVPLLGGVIGLSTAAATLARQARAPLLPVFAIGDGEGRFRVIVEAPLPLEAGVSGRQGIEQAITSGAAVLEKYIRRYPDQWSGWSQLAFSALAAVIST